MARHTSKNGGEHSGLDLVLLRFKNEDLGEVFAFLLLIEEVQANVSAELDLLDHLGVDVGILVVPARPKDEAKLYPPIGDVHRGGKELLENQAVQLQGQDLHEFLPSLLAGYRVGDLEVVEDQHIAEGVEGEVSRLVDPGQNEHALLAKEGAAGGNSELVASLLEQRVLEPNAVEVLEQLLDFVELPYLGLGLA